MVVEAQTKPVSDAFHFADVLWPFYSYFFLDSELARLFLGHWHQTQTLVSNEEEAFVKSFAFFRNYEGAEQHRQDLHDLNIWQEFRQNEAISPPPASVFFEHAIYDQAEQLDPLARAVLFLAYVKGLSVGQMVSVLSLNSIEVEGLKRQAFKLLVRQHLKNPQGSANLPNVDVKKDLLDEDMTCFLAQENFFNFFPKTDVFLADSQRIEKHLASCACCQQKWQQYENFFGTLNQFKKIPFPENVKIELAVSQPEHFGGTYLELLKKWFRKIDRKGKFRRPA